MIYRCGKAEEKRNLHIRRLPRRKCEIPNIILSSHALKPVRYIRHTIMRHLEFIFFYCLSTNAPVIRGTGRSAMQSNFRYLSWNTPPDSSKPNEKYYTAYAFTIAEAQRGPLAYTKGTHMIFVRQDIPSTPIERHDSSFTSQSICKLMKTSLLSQSMCITFLLSRWMRGRMHHIITGWNKLESHLKTRLKY